MINRHISKKLLLLNRQYPVTAILGPRQSGKTTLAKQVFPQKTYFNLEDPELREFVTNDPKGFLNKQDNKQGIIIDEIQHVPSLFSYLQILVDEEQSYGKYVLTGSHNILLSEKITQSLAGRVCLFNLLPLSFGEISQANIKYKNLEDYIFKGFYPRLYDNPNIDINNYYKNYLQTYIERDVRTIKNISNLYDFQKFIKLCAGRTGQLLNLSSLADDCGISHNTVKSWIAVLESSFIIFLLHPYNKNINKRYIKMPKLFFNDTGLLTYLLGIKNKEDLNSHYLIGNIFKNFIITEIVKYFFNQGVLNNCYFLRNKKGQEIDFLVENFENKLQAMEIKFGKTVVKDFFKNINFFQKKLSTIIDLYVIYGGDETQNRTNVTVKGWRDFLSQLDQIF